MPRNNLNKIGNLAEPQKSEDRSLGREGEKAEGISETSALCLRTSAFKIGDRVTVKSVPATAIVCFRPTKLELAAYPNLVGVSLTIESIDEPWIICCRDNGSRTLALVAEDLRLIDSVGEDVSKMVPSELCETRQEVLVDA